MVIIKEALTFDDVLMLPRFSSILPSSTDISLKLTNNINLKVPFLSSAMDTVTEAKMAIAIADSGGIGIIHRNLSSQNQSKEVFKVKKKKLVVGAAVGTNSVDCCARICHSPTAWGCLLYTSPSPRDTDLSRMPSSA